jgi:hypothetical protein
MTDLARPDQTLIDLRLVSPQQISNPRPRKQGSEVLNGENASGECTKENS